MQINHLSLPLAYQANRFAAQNGSHANPSILPLHPSHESLDFPVDVASRHYRAGEEVLRKEPNLFGIALATLYQRAARRANGDNMPQ